MNVSLYDCYQGLKAQMDRLEVVSNNLANLDTPGFKADKSFISLFQQAVKGSGADTHNYLMASSYTDFETGVLTQTENPLDLAVEGKGFFTVKTPTGLAYTRNGSFRLSSEGYLVTQDGNRVQGTSGDIQIPSQGDVTIDQMGNISAGGVPVGTLKIVDFTDYSGLEKTGASLFRIANPTTKETPPTEFTIRQGYRENSNVKATETMVDVITILRRFEMLQKALQSMRNDIDRKVVDQVGTVR